MLQGVKKRGRPKGAKNKPKHEPPAEAALPIACEAREGGHQGRAAPRRQAPVDNMAVHAVQHA